MRPLQLLWAMLLLLPAPRAAAAPRAEVTVLSYHEIADEADALSPSYSVTPTNFLRQMDWLRNHGYRFVSLDDVLASREGRRPLPEKAVLVTFDDAYRSIHLHAWPVLRMFGIPAVVNVVGSWLEAKDTIDFDGRPRPRAAVIDWKALREMVDSGLVEVGSHSWDLHRGIVGNPQGNLQPAGTTRRWLADEKQYESEVTYRRRVQADLERNSDLIRRRVGRAPRVIAWPYGRYNAVTRDVALGLGMKVGLTLDDGANSRETPLYALRRLLMERSMSLVDFARELGAREQDLSDQDRPQVIAHVDLDYVHDADPAQQERNLGHLLDRLQKLGVNTVYLQAFSDADGNGSADAVYFPCRRLPMRADLFNRVAWQIRTRTQVRRLYAWMPALGWELPAADPAAGDVVRAIAGEHPDRLNMGYRRLSPFSPGRARRSARSTRTSRARRRSTACSSTTT